MIILLLFAFVAGFATILSPCILPILPIILSSSVDSSGKKRPLGIVAGFIGSFTFFTLFLSTIVSKTGLNPNILRLISVAILATFGFSLLIPKLQLIFEQLFARLTRVTPDTQQLHGFAGGLLIGLSLGLLWTPCVGPILASVISLALTGQVTSVALLITITYALGTAIPMLVILLTGNAIFSKLPTLLPKLSKIQQLFGLIMILTSIAILFNFDRRFQTYIITHFPNYGTGLTQFEDNQLVSENLQKLVVSNDNQSSNKTNSSAHFSPSQSPKRPLAPELNSSGEWFNSKPLTLQELRGKVVLIDFWTYSCINCQRTLPYLKTWWQKYQSKGLVIIGVHAPEFEFEKDSDNVARAIQDFQITYPVVQDNNFDTWRAYDNHYWPAKYLIDANGRIRYTHFGEGAYDKTESIIQQLLIEAGERSINDPINNQPLRTFSQTPETYVGYKRIANFAQASSLKKDQAVLYNIPQTLSPNQFAFGGSWLVESESATANQNAQLDFRFNAKDVYVVMNPVSESATVEVLLDGQSSSWGLDVVKGQVLVDRDRLYHLVHLDKPVSHTLILKFNQGQVRIFAFTFG